MVGIHGMAVAIALCGVGGVPPRGSAFAPPSSPSRRPPPPAVVVSTSSSSSSSSSAESSAAEVVVSASAPAAPDAIVVVGGKRKRTLRIAVVGAGAVGSYYGGRLWEGSSATGGGGVDRDGDGDGDDDDDDDDRAIETTSAVAFHLRGEHYDHCTRHGLSVSSCHGDFDIPPSELSAYRTTEDMARSLILAADDVDDDDDGSGGGGGGGEYFDWVVCALKSTSVSVRFRSSFVYCVGVSVDENEKEHLICNALSLSTSFEEPPFSLDSIRGEVHSTSLASRR